MEKVKRTAVESMMFAHIVEWQKSGTTQKEFCKEHEIPVARFYYWMKRHKKQRSDVSGFLPVRVEENPGINEWIEIIYPNGVRLHTSQGTSLRVLRELIMLG